MILECWTWKRLGKDISGVESAGNVDWKDGMVLSEFANMEVPRLDMLQSPGYFGLGKGQWLQNGLSRAELLEGCCWCWTVHCGEVIDDTNVKSRQDCGCWTMRQ
jgi:hypothetical protein